MASGTIVEQSTACNLLSHPLKVLTDRQRDAPRQSCCDYARSLYPDAMSIQPVRYQGGCSYSLLVQPRSSQEPHGEGESCQHDRILQFRPPKFDLDIDTLCKAKEVYGSLVPTTISHGQAVIGEERQVVYEMTAFPGARLSELLPRKRKLVTSQVEQVRAILCGMVGLLARGWKHAVSTYAFTNEKQAQTGRVGSTIQDRLQKLAEQLPTFTLRAKAQSVLEAVQEALGGLPVVLSHGDLLPSNIMVDPYIWELHGVIDWAEAECLPFGMALYAVDHCLGFLDDVGDSAGCRWMWYEQAETLRRVFWENLQTEISDLYQAELMKSVIVARDVGVLLWHGFAWDDGRINRVVNAVDDREELEVLRAFLEVA